jgi:hypothetical protein
VHRRVPAALALLALVALVAAGCGANRGKPYTAAASAPCFREKGFTNVTTNPGKVGLIAGFAENGGLQATAPDRNVVTIAFTAADSNVPGTEKAFRNAAPARYKHHMQDIMESSRNAVLVWTVTPKQDLLTTALGCLKS